MEAIGLNLSQIISYIIIFILFYFIVRRFVRKLIATTEERKRIIEDGIKNAEEAAKLKSIAIDDAREEKQSILSEAYKSVQDTIDSAKLKQESIIESAKVRADMLLKDSAHELSELREKAKLEGIKEAKEIIALAIKKAFEGYTLDKATKEKLIEESLKNIK